MNLWLKREDIWRSKFVKENALFADVLRMKHTSLLFAQITHLRDDLLISVREKLNEPVENFDSEKMLKYFLGNIEIAPIVAKYLNRTMELRKFLIDNPKRYFWKQFMLYVFLCAFLCGFMFVCNIVMITFLFFPSL